MQEIIEVTHGSGSWITNHICAMKCRAPGSRGGSVQCPSGLPCTAESKQCCAQLGDKVLLSHLGHKSASLHCNGWELHLS